MNRTILNQSSEIKIQEIEDCYSKELTSEQIIILSEMLKDPDKGVRNSVAFFFINSEYELIPFKVVEYVKSPDTAIRNLAGDILLKKGNASVPALLNFIDFGNDDDKKFCIDILGLIGNAVACDKIIATLNKSENDNLTLACLEALGNLKCSDLEKVVAPIYTKNELFKPTIIEALGKAGSDEVIQFLIDVFEEEDELIKYAIIEALGLIGKPETVEFLIAKIKSETYSLVGPLVNSIYQLVNNFGIQCKSSDKIIEKIIAASDFIDQEHAMAVVSFLAKNINPDVIYVFMKLFGKDFEVDMIIRQALDDNKNIFIAHLPEYFSTNANNIFDLLNYLKELLYTSQEIVHEQNDVKINNLTDSLVKLMSNRADDVRASSAEILHGIAPEKGIANVDKMISDQNVWNRMGYLENYSAVQPFPDEFVKKFAIDSDEMIRERAIAILQEHNLTFSGV